MDHASVRQSSFACNTNNIETFEAQTAKPLLGGLQNDLASFGGRSAFSSLAFLLGSPCGFGAGGADCAGLLLMLVDQYATEIRKQCPYLGRAFALLILVIGGLG